MQTTASTIKVLTITSVDPSTGIKNALLKKQKEEHPTYEPTGWFWTGNSLFHTGLRDKNKKIKKEKVIISRPDGLTTFEYINQYILPNNKKFAESWKDVSEKGENAFKNLILSTEETKEVNELFSGQFFIAKDGTILQIDNKNVLDCKIRKPYWNALGSNLQVNLLADLKSAKIHKEQSVSGLVKNVWGEDAYNEFIKKEDEIREQMAVREAEAV